MFMHIVFSSHYNPIVETPAEWPAHIPPGWLYPGQSPPTCALLPPASPALASSMPTPTYCQLHEYLNLWFGALISTYTKITGPKTCPGFTKGEKLQETQYLGPRLVHSSHKKKIYFFLHLNPIFLLYFYLVFCYHQMQVM